MVPWLRRALEAVTTLQFIALVAVILLQVIVRYVIKIPLVWTEEFVRFTLVWLVLLSSALVMDRGEHIEIDLLDRYLPPALRRWRAAIVALLSAVFLLVLARQGFTFMQRGFAVSPAMRLPLRWVYAAIPVGAVLMLVFLAARSFAAPRNTPDMRGD